MKMPVPSVRSAVADAPRGQLFRDVAIANDGARDELREQRDIETVVDDVPLRRRPAHIDVDQVGDRVEREKGNAEQEAERPQPEFGEPQRPQRPVEVVEREERVLRDAQEREIEADAEPERPDRGSTLFVGAIDRAADPIVDGDRQWKEQQARRLSPRVEEKACGEEKRIAETVRADVVDGEQHRQESEQKSAGREKHGTRRPPYLVKMVDSFA